MGGDENEYQLQPSRVVIPQVLLKVEIAHVLIDKTERVCLGRVHPHERYYIHTFVLKEAAYVNFIAKPLQRNSQRCTRYRSRLQRTATTRATSNDS